jgi:hypothetical protein
MILLGPDLLSRRQFGTEPSRAAESTTMRRREMIERARYRIVRVEYVRITDLRREGTGIKAAATSQCLLCRALLPVTGSRNCDAPPSLTCLSRIIRP